MSLTAAQKTALKTDILANTNTVLYQGVSTQIKLVPNTSDGNQAVADWYNQLASPAYIVWRDLPMLDVLNLITFANMTPLDAVPTTPDLTVQVWTARSTACQGKQFNLQNLIFGRETAPMKRTNYRAALQDALTNIPAGAAGALVSANWVGVRDAAKFSATNFEKLRATGSGTSGTPSDLEYEGSISGGDVHDALNS